MHNYGYFALVIALTGVFGLGVSSAAEQVTAAEAVMARMALDQALAPVHGRAQFEAWSALHQSADENPYLVLSPGAQRRFLAALDAWEVTEGAAPDAADLENELSLTQAVRLLMVVGSQTIGVLHMPDIRVESAADKVADAWRQSVKAALVGNE